MAQDILMVVGLGNPGPDYANTRHNAGALFVEALARETGQSLRPEKKYHGLYARIQLQGLDLHLLNPSTYMNRSGLSIKALADFFKIQPQQILVAHDELDLPPGTAKLKKAAAMADTTACGTPLLTSAPTTSSACASASATPATAARSQAMFSAAWANGKPKNSTP